MEKSDPSRSAVAGIHRVMPLRRCECSVSRKAPWGIYRDESGVTGVEYGLIAALVGVALVGTVSVMGDDLGDVFSTVTGALDKTNTDLDAANFEGLDPGWAFGDLNGARFSGWGYTGALEGWKNTGGAVEMVYSGMGGVYTPDGSPWIDMDANAGQRLTLSRSLDVPDGLDVALDFFAADRLRNSASMDVYFGGEKVASIDPTTPQLQKYSLAITGGAGDGSNELKFVETGRADGYGTALWGVSLK